MKQPVRGGLKGGRRSVKRGQSVEFADYRDYTLGDDLRQLDWNVYARLEQLFVKLFVEEEDVTVDVPPRRQPVDGLRQAPRSCCSPSALRRRSGTSPSRARTGSSRCVLSGRMARRHAGLRGSGRVFRLLGEPVGDPPAEGPTDLPLAARHAAAMLSGRGVVVLISDLLDPGADRVDPRARRDRVGADRPAHAVPRRARPGPRGRPASSSTARPATGST